MQLTADMSRVHPEVRHRIIKNLQHADAAQHALGRIRQARMKKLYDAVVQPGFNTEIGRMNFIIDEDQAARCRALYGDLCFMDPAFVRWLQKNHDDMRVKDVGTRVQSGWTGASERGRRNAERGTVTNAERGMRNGKRGTGTIMGRRSNAALPNK